MSDIQLFRLSSGIANELQGGEFDLETPLHTSNEQSPGRSSLNRKSKEKTHA